MKTTALLLALCTLFASTSAQAPNTDDGQNQPAAPPPTSDTSSINLPPGGSFVSLSETGSLTSTPFTISQRSDVQGSQSPLPLPPMSANTESVTVSLTTQNPSGPSFGQGGVAGGVSSSGSAPMTSMSSSSQPQSRSASSMGFNVNNSAADKLSVGLSLAAVGLVAMIAF